MTTGAIPGDVGGDAATEKEAARPDTPDAPDTMDHVKYGGTQARQPFVSRTQVPFVQAVFETCLIALGPIANFVLLPHNIYHYDSWVRFTAISQLIQQGTLSNIKYSLIGPLFSIPVWYLSKLYQTPMWWIERYNTFVFALGLLMLYWLLRNRIDRTLLRTFLLLLSAASMFPNHLTTYYGEVFTAVCVAVGLVAAVVAPAIGSIGAWGLVVLGVANTPVSLIGLGLVVLRRAWAKKRLRYAAAFVAAGLLIGGEAWLRRGSPFSNGYVGDASDHTVMPYSGEPGFSYPAFFGILSIFLSFGKGLIFFTPGLFLPVRRRILALCRAGSDTMLSIYGLWISFVVGLVLAYMSWWAWYGGWFWGPRFFLFAAIPASFALALWLRQREQSLFANLLTLVVLLLSCWVGLDGAIFGQQAMGVCQMNNYQYEMLCYYTPEFSALWRPFVVWDTSGLRYTLAVEHVNHHIMLYAAYVLVVLLYLATPLVLRILRQVRVLALHLFAMWRLSLAYWRF